MSVTLEQQLRDYGGHFQSVLRTIDIDEVLAEPVGAGPVRPLQPRRPRKRSWPGVAVAALAFVVVLLGGAALLWQVTGSDTPASTTPPTDPTPTTLAEPALTNEWSRVSESVLGDGQMRSVSVGGPGFVGVGSTAAGDEHGDAAVWTSVDGITWTRVPDDDAVFGDGAMSSVTVGGPGLVAVGSSVWTSVDGITWNRLPHDEEVFGEEGPMSVTAGGPGLVAVGSTAEGEDGEEDAAVWTSVDGITWSRVPHDEANLGGPGDQSMWNVAVGGPGLVAVGVDWAVDADAAVWTSVDGIAWSRVPHDEEIFGGPGHQASRSVTAGGPGLVAVGVERSARMQGVVWTSVDGLTWTRVPRHESGALDRGEMTSVAVGDSGLVAVGWIGRIGGPNSDAAVWTSSDGIVWSRVHHNEEAFGHGVIWRLTKTDGGLVAVGTDGSNAAVWVEASDN